MLFHFAWRFAVRWAVSSLGLWIAAAVLGASHMSFSGNRLTVIWAGLFLALVNMAIKPLLVILSFPAIVLSLGLFMVVINGFIILIVHWLYGGLYVSSLWSAMLAGIIVGLVNFLVTKIMEDI